MNKFLKRFCVGAVLIVSLTTISCSSGQKVDEETAIEEYEEAVWKTSELEKFQLKATRKQTETVRGVKTSTSATLDQRLNTNIEKMLYRTSGTLSQDGIKISLSQRVAYNTGWLYVDGTSYVVDENYKMEMDFEYLDYSWSYSRYLVPMLPEFSFGDSIAFKSATRLGKRLTIKFAAKSYYVDGRDVIFDGKNSGVVVIDDGMIVKLSFDMVGKTMESDYYSLQPKLGRIEDHGSYVLSLNPTFNFNYLKTIDFADDMYVR